MLYIICFSYAQLAASISDAAADVLAQRHDRTGVGASSSASDDEHDDNDNNNNNNNNDDDLDGDDDGVDERRSLRRRAPHSAANPIGALRIGALLAHDSNPLRFCDRDIVEEVCFFFWLFVFDSIKH
jgi:hypothetical protein